MTGRYKLRHRKRGSAELSIEGTSVRFSRSEGSSEVQPCQSAKEAEAALNKKLEALYGQGWEIVDILTTSSEAAAEDARQQEAREAKPSTTAMIQDAMCSRKGDAVVIDVEATSASSKQIREIWERVAGGQPRSLWIRGALEPPRGYMRTLRPWCDALRRQQVPSLETLVVANCSMREPGVRVGNMATLLAQFPKLRRLHLEGDGSFAGLEHETLETACLFGPGGRALRELLSSECPRLKTLALAAHFTRATDDQALAAAWPPKGLSSLQTLVIGWSVDPLPILRAVADNPGVPGFESLRLVERSVTYPGDNLSWNETLRWLETNHEKLSHLKEVGLPFSLAFKPDRYEPLEPALVERLRARMSNLVDTDKDTFFSPEHPAASDLRRERPQGHVGFSRERQ